MRKSAYQEEIKIDSGFLEGKKFSKNLCEFFSLLKGNKICENLYVNLLCTAHAQLPILAHKQQPQQTQPIET